MLESGNSELLDTVPMTIPQRLPEVREALLGLGLTDAELECYEILLRKGSSAPGEIARLVRQSRPQVYRLLRSLVEKGLAHEAASRPIRYTPVRLGDVLAATIETLQSRARALEVVVANLPTSERERPPEARPIRPGDVTIVSGRRAVMAEIRRLVQQAGEFFYLGGPGRFAERLLAHPSLMGGLRTAIERGARLRLFVPASPETERSRTQLREDLGDRILVEVSPDLLPPVVEATNDFTALTIFPQPENDAPLQGDDLGVRVASERAVEAIVQRFELIAAKGPQENAPRLATTRKGSEN